ncbi:MAG: methyltransferase [Candidatus Methanomethylicus sp.]|nr:methyltransferase [Candidatus Methanomethylicus sp.]
MKPLENGSYLAKLEREAKAILDAKLKPQGSPDKKQHRGSKTSHYYSNAPSMSKEKFLLRLCIKGQFIDLASSGGIFSKNKIDLGTLVLIESLTLPENGEILDMGCGYGPIGITVSKIKPLLKVTMVDINPTAVKLARENTERNNVGTIEVLHSDLYDSLGDRTFNAIISNPPLAAGYGVIHPLIEGAFVHLKEGGYLQLVLRRGTNAIPNKMKAVFGNFELVSKKSGYKVFRSVKTKADHVPIFFKAASDEGKKRKAKKEVLAD